MEASRDQSAITALQQGVAADADEAVIETPANASTAVPRAREARIEYEIASWG